MFRVSLFFYASFFFISGCFAQTGIVSSPPLSPLPRPQAALNTPTPTTSTPEPNTPTVLPSPTKGEAVHVTPVTAQQVAIQLESFANAAIASEEIYLVTTNAENFLDVLQVLPNVKLLRDDLVDIQQTDPKAILSAKMQQAFYLSKGRGQFLFEDTSLYMEALNGLPGPLGKWFLQKIGNEGLVNIARAFGNYRAEITTYYAYGKTPTEVYFFEGHLKGDVVSMRGDLGVSFEAIFQPQGQSLTLAEMDPITRNAFSTRRFALGQMRDFLSQKNIQKK